MRRLLSTVSTVCVSTALLFTPTITNAVSLVTSDGGVKVVGANKDYWFKVSGTLKVDQRIYWDDTKATSWDWSNAGTYNSGAFIRDVGLTFEGGLGTNWSYNIALNFDAFNSLSRVDDAYVSYHGFCNFLPNFKIDIGQVIPGFCLTCASSSKWIPFLERSMGTNTFGPQQGLGVNFNTYNNSYTSSLTITQQPKTGITVRDTRNNVINKPDLWQVAFRYNYRPIFSDCRVLQLGFSADIEEYSNTGLRYNPVPETKSGSTITLLDTAIPLSSTRTNLQLISARNQKTIDFEVLGIYGSWSGEMEYQRAYIARGYDEFITNTAKQGPNLTFSGYHAQVSYILTGEVRPLKTSNATLGQVIPRCPYGAWEVSARYSYISLNSHDINGGRAHNTSASVCCYINRNLKAIGEYVYSKQERQFPTYLDSRNVQSIGARLQAVF